VKTAALIPAPSATSKAGTASHVVAVECAAIAAAYRYRPRRLTPGRATAALLYPRHHAADLPRFPYSAAARGWDAALIERHRDPVPGRYAARLYLRCLQANAKGTYLEMAGGVDQFQVEPAVGQRWEPRPSGTLNTPPATRRSRCTFCSPSAVKRDRLPCTAGSDAAMKPKMHAAAAATEFFEPAGARPDL
jgi:hypothetical protein